MHKHVPKIFKVINHKVGKAIHKYNMINDGDHIAVGLSGGKDSMVLLNILYKRLSFIPIKYKLLAIHIDPGFDNGFSQSLKDFCEKQGYDLHIEYTDFGIKAHNKTNKLNPCFLCSRLKRKRIFEIANQFGYNKIALGHNKDDIIETLFINMFYSGELSTMLPYQPMFKEKFFIIRPLAFADSEKIKNYLNKLNLPEYKNPCPSSINSRRNDIREMLVQLYKSNNKIKGNIFKALNNIKTDYLL